MMIKHIVPLTLALMTVAASGTAFGQLGWTELNPTASPAARYGHAMVRIYPSYQPLLFGGTNGTLAFGDTWMWDGQDWTQLATTGPAPRHGHAMEYLHFTDDSVLLFGGRDAGGNLLGDTWIWNGSSWGQMAAATSPSARAGHAMARNEMGIRTLLLFGGRTASGLSDETWRSTDSQWTLVPTLNRPPAREGHSLVYVTGEGKYLLFGGRSDTAILDDIWEFDGFDWTYVGTLSAPIADTSVIYSGSWRRRVLVFGGGDGTLNSNTVERLASGEWVGHATVGSPSPRDKARFAMCFHSLQEHMILFGGRDASGTALGETFRLEALTLPTVETFGQGCGPGAWSLDGGPDVFVFGSALLGSSVDVIAYTQLPGTAAFLIGTEMLNPPAGCGLLVDPVRIEILAMEELFVGLSQAIMELEIPFVPSLAGLQVSLQVVMAATGGSRTGGLSVINPQRRSLSVGTRITLAE